MSNKAKRAREYYNLGLQAMGEEIAASVKRQRRRAALEAIADGVREIALQYVNHDAEAPTAILFMPFKQWLAITDAFRVLDGVQEDGNP